MLRLVRIAVVGRFGAAVAALVVSAGLLVAGHVPAVFAAPIADDPSGLALSEREAVAKAKVRRQPVEVFAARTERSQTFARPDGSLVTDQYLRPRWVRRGELSWVSADATLRLGSDGVVRPVASVADVAFSGGGDRVVGRLTAGGRSLGLTWPQALPVPVLEGVTATYRNVLPDVDLQVVSDVDGFTHLVVVKTAAAAQHPLVRELALGTQLSGLTLRVQPGTGVVEAVDGAGSVVFGGPSPTMWDSSAGLVTVREKGAAAPSMQGIASGLEQPGLASAVLEPRTAKVEARIAGGSLLLIPDASMLSDPETVFPVYIDPTWTPVGGDRNAWTLLRSSFPTTSHWNRVEGGGTTSGASDELAKGIVRAGYSADSVRTYRDRSLFNMNISAVKHKSINKATFSLTQAWSWWNNCAMSNPPTTDLKVVGAFGSATTWSNQPAWGRTLASSAKIHKYGLSCGPQQVEFDVTGRVRELAAAGTSAMDLGLISRNDNGVTGNWARFRLSTLVLSMEYNTNPDAPTVLTVAGKTCATGSGRPYVLDSTPEFNGKAADMDSGQQSLTTRYYWWKATETRGTDFVAGTSGNPGPVSPVSVPAAKALLDQTVYQYQASTIDDVGGLTWSGVCEFRTSLNAPGQPLVSSSAYPVYNPQSPGSGSGGVGIPGSFTITAPASGYQDIVGYGYTLDSGLTSAAAPFVAAVGGVGGVVSVTPKKADRNRLRVWAKDVAGRFSTVVEYEFKVRDGSGAVATWVFETAAAPGEDDTGHANSLAVFGGAVTAAGRAGVGSALDLNGSTAYAGMGALSQPHPDTGSSVTVRTDSSFTVAAWVRLDTTGGTGLRAAVSAPAANSSAFVLGYSGAVNRWVFQMSGTDVTGAAVTSVQSDAAPMVGRWTHLAASYDVATKRLRLFVMGAEQAAPTATTLSGSGFHAAQFELGRYEWDDARTGYLDGAVDDVRMYAFTLSVATTEFDDTLKPLPPIITFPNGSNATAGGSVAVKFDASGDTNVTSFKYSVGTALLDQTVTVTPAGGTVNVSIPVLHAGEVRIFAATLAADRQSPERYGTVIVAALPKVSGVVYDTGIQPVAGATVILEGSGLAVVTQADGSYSLTGFPAGNYLLAAYRDGQCGQSSASRITVSGAVRHDFILMPVKDMFGHECVTQPGTPFETANGVALPLSGDDAVTEVVLPFMFPFYDGSHTSAWVDTNGLIAFSNPAGSRPAGERNIPSPAEPNDLIAVFWDDLVVDAAASVVIESAEVQGVEVFIVEWRNVHLKGDPSARLTAQARLDQFGFILLNYAGIDSAAEQGLNTVVGIESPGGGMGIQYSYRQAVLANDTLVAFTRPFITETIDTFAVSGVVSDAATGQPMAGVEVKLEPAQLTATTAANGSYSFPDLEAGSYYVSAATAPFCGRYGNAHINLSGESQANLALQLLADAFGNTCVAGLRGFAPVDTLLALTGDDAYAAVGLPFPVGFYGQGYTTAWVDTNGVVTFATPVDAANNVSEIPSLPQAHTPNTAVYPLWEDWWVDASASVWTGVSGAAPNRQFVIEWRNVRHFDDPTARVSFQSVFYENGDIGIAWDGIDIVSLIEIGTGAVVGIENSGGTEALAYSMLQPVLTSGQGVLFRPGTAIGTAGTLTGTATCQGNPAVGVVVAVAGQSTTTAADGSWQIADIAAGAHTVVSTPDSGPCTGSTMTQTAVVGGTTATVNVALVPVGGYTVVAGPQSFVAVDTPLVLGGDDAYTAVSFPFPVTVFGPSHTTGWVDTNGVVTFTAPDGPAYNVSTIPSTASSNTPNNAVYALWDDWWVDNEASVWSGTQGAAPNRRFAIEWRNVRHFSSSNARVSFQAVFNENGDITTVWQGLDDSFTERGGTAVVGIESAAGNQAVVYSQQAPAIRDGQGVLFHPPVPPPSTGILHGIITCVASPAAGVNVTVGALSAVTAADGTWQITGLPAGAYTIVSTSDIAGCLGSTVTPVTVIGGADVAANVMLADNAYTVSAGPRGFEPVTDAVELSGDDFYTQITLPFPVTLYGQTYPTAWVDTNGVVSFTAPDQASNDISPIPSAAQAHRPNAAVYPFWEDWRIFSQSSVWTGQSGIAPNRTFVVEWRNAESFRDSARRVSFQVVFYESGQIAIAWDGIDTDYTERGGHGVVGLENSSGTAAMVYSQFAPVLRSGQGVLFTPIDLPAPSPGPMAFADPSYIAARRPSFGRP